VLTDGWCVGMAAVRQGGERSPAARPAACRSGAPGQQVAVTRLRWGGRARLAMVAVAAAVTAAMAASPAAAAARPGVTTAAGMISTATGRAA